MASLQRYLVKGIEYWRLVESRRINGKPTPVVVEYFGNTKKFTEMLLNGRNEHKIVKSYSHGDSFALMKIAQRLNIEKILDDHMSSKSGNGLKRSKSLLLIALQSVCKPGSKNEFESWVKTTTLPYDHDLSPEVLTSRHFWKQMDNISEVELVAAEDAITQKIFSLYDFDLEKIALDYTNYFSYVSSSNDRCTLAKRGRNKQKRHDLRQYSLALITTKESGLPLYSHIYEGNKNDQTVFAKYIGILKERIPDYDPDAITLVFDGGSNTKANLETLETHYICGFSLSSCKPLFDIDISSYYDIKYGDKSSKGYRVSHEIWGKEHECILTFSRPLYEGQVKELNESIASTVSSLDSLNEQLNNPKSRIAKTIESITAKIKSICGKKYMDEIFDYSIIVHPESGLVSCVEYSIVDSAKNNITHKYFGKKLLITDRKDWSTSEILKTYREQDCIEKIFRATKDNDHCAIRPQFHYTDQKIRVHIFCCLLGLTLATILHMEVVNKGIEASKFQMLDILQSIRRCWLKDKDSSKVTNVLEEMDDTQAALWNVIQSI